MKKIPFVTFKTRVRDKSIKDCSTLNVYAEIGFGDNILKYLEIE